MVAGDEPRGAGTRAVALDRRNGCLFDTRVLGEIEVIVAGERDELATAAPHADILPGRVDEAAPQVPSIEIAELFEREGIERLHLS